MFEGFLAIWSQVEIVTDIVLRCVLLINTIRKEVLNGLNGNIENRKKVLELG